MKKIIHSALAIMIFFPAAAQANWSWGLGYHNPPGATAGLNFMYLWTNWAVELGLGYIGSNENSNTSSSNNNKTTYTVAGDANLKYLFGTSFFRPYLQGGFGTSVSTTSNSGVNAGASLGSPFGGLGFFLMGKSMYFYASYLIAGQNYNTFQVGIGF